MLPTRYAVLRRIAVASVLVSAFPIGATESPDRVCMNFSLIASRAGFPQPPMVSHVELDDHDLLVLEKFLQRPQPLAALIQVSANRLAGMTWPSALRLRPTHQPTFASLREARTYFESDLLQYSARAQGEGTISARYSVFPIAFYGRPLTEFGGIPRSAFVFNMSLHESAVRDDFKNELVESYQYPHQQNSMGYIRFYRKGSDVVVVEIQSEIFKQIQSSETKQKYRNWSKQILLAFESFVEAKIFSKLPEKNGRILIAGPDYQQRRWRGGETALSPDLARIIYRDFPKKLGYSAITISYAVEWPGHLGVRRPEPIGQAYAIDQVTLAESKAPLRIDYRKSETQNPSNSLVENLNLLKAVASSLALQRASPQGTALSFNHSAIVPYEQFPPGLLYHGSERLKRTHERALLNLPAWVTSENWREQTAVSLSTAPVGGVLEDEISLNGESYRFVEWVGSDRHPTLTITSDPEWSLSLKGAGRRTLEDKPQIRRQIFSIQKTRTESHRVQGGLTETHALQEFWNHLAVLDLGRSIGIEPSIALPVDVGWMRQLPKIVRNGVQFKSMEEYFRTELTAAPERIVQFRTMVKSINRVSVVPLLLRAESPTMFVREARAMLEATYRAYGKTLVLDHPRGPLLQDRGWPNHAEAFGFLNSIYRLNQTSADQILREFAQKTLQTIGMIHGAGGHLGGTEDSIFDGPDGSVVATHRSLGAPSGGATQFRNMTLAGEIRDLDSNVYIPGSLDESWLSDMQVLKYNLSWFQGQDLRHWQETWYWICALMKGKESVPPGVQFPFLIFGDPSSASGLILREVAKTDEQKVISQYLEEDHRAAQVLNNSRSAFSDPELQQIYGDAFNRSKLRAGF